MGHKKLLSNLPKITSSDRERSDLIQNISASAMIKFSSNPIMFKILYKNRQRIDSAMGGSGIVGKAFHYAMEVFYSEGNIAEGLRAGTEYINEYNEGFIKFNATYPNKQKMIEKLVLAYNFYIGEVNTSQQDIVSLEEMIEEMIDVEWRGERYSFPVPLKGYLDKIVRENGELVIVDYKTCASFSDPDKIDGAKMLQAVEYFFLVYAKYGEAPKKIRYEEVKLSKNRDESPQVRCYEIDYTENDLYFDFFLRFIVDMLASLSGEMRYVPNVYAMFDNDIAIVAYIQRLDMEEEVAKRMKAEKVETITELLKRDIQKTSNMKSLLRAAEKSLSEAKNIDYSNMTTSEKIETKMLEHGMILKKVDTIRGASVEMHRFTTGIGIKMSRIRNYADDIEQVVGKAGVRILAPIPNSTMIGIEIPLEERNFPSVPEGNGFDVAFGLNVMGEDVRFDIRNAPHLLVAGATGSGKSVFLASMIEQLRKIPNSELILLDPKRVELVRFKQYGEYLNSTDLIAIKLEDLCAEMEQRYSAMEGLGVNNISETDMPYKFVILDEYGEMIVDKSLGVMQNVLRLAQLARSCGIHLILATQRPSVDIVTGSIKANFPTRVCFKVASATDSRVVLDESGAERLLGKGDMLMHGVDGLERLQGYNI